MLPVPESYVGHAAEFYIACAFLLLCSISFPIVIYDYFWFRQWRMRAALYRAYHRGYSKGFRKNPYKRTKFKSPLKLIKGIKYDSKETSFRQSRPSRSKETC